MKYLLALLLLLPAAAFAANVQITCTAPTKNTDGSSITGAITYNFYGALQGATKTKLNGTPAASCANTWVNAPVGNVCATATAIVNGVESDPSAESCTVVAAPKPNAPGAPTLTVTVANTTAYKLRQSVDGIQLVAIGSVPSGTICGAHNVDGYTLIPRASVTLASKFDTLPLTVYAQCS